MHKSTKRKLENGGKVRQREQERKKHTHEKEKERTNDRKEE